MYWARQTGHLVMLYARAENGTLRYRNPIYTFRFRLKCSIPRTQTPTSACMCVSRRTVCQGLYERDVHVSNYQTIARKMSQRYFGIAHKFSYGYFNPFNKYNTASRPTMPMQCISVYLIRILGYVCTSIVCKLLAYVMLYSAYTYNHV